MRVVASVAWTFALAALAGVASCTSGGASVVQSNGTPCPATPCPQGLTCNAGVCQSPNETDGAVDDKDSGATPKDGGTTSACTCDKPPANVCANTTSLRVYAAAGACDGDGGACTYGETTVPCPTGCNTTTARCNSTGWSVMDSNVTVTLQTVWAATAAYAWAGGDTGTVVHWNGTQWQVRPTGTFSPIAQIHGTSETNVVALAGATILHFDGAAWSNHPSPVQQTASVFALGPKDVLVFGTNGGTPILVRFHDAGGPEWEATTLKEGGFRGANFNARMWASSLNAVYVPGGNLWNGESVKQLGSPTYSNRGPGRLWGSAAFLLGLDWQNGVTPLYEYKTASDAWVPVPTGFAGVLDDFHGASDKRVFAVGYLNLGGGALGGRILYFDGTGWTNPTLPSGVVRLRSVWSLASGEVFAVGDDGTILRGP